jgi:protocatechuate 3,4-dioxygenase beta subunit
MIDSKYVADFRAYERSLQTGPQNERVAHCVNRLMDVLMPLVLKPTREEWDAMTAYISGLGPVHTKLVLWLVGLTQLMEEINSNIGPEATQMGVEGPFFAPGAPLRPEGASLSEDPAGADWLFLEGIVTDVAGKPLPNVTMEAWAANHKGTYSNFDLEAVPFDCRGKVVADAQGRYKLQTPYPAQYAIKGPGAQLLTAIGRQLWRPRHVHFMIDHPGFEKLIMQVCFEGDEFARIDSALAVKEEHIIPIAHHTDAAAIKARGLDKPFYTGTYDFKLQPVIQASSKAA